MRWKKSVTALMLSAVLAIGAAGCSKEEPQEGATQSEGGGLSQEAVKKAIEESEN